jgi:hypothetical protein
VSPHLAFIAGFRTFPVAVVGIIALIRGADASVAVPRGGATRQVADAAYSADSK